LVSIVGLPPNLFLASQFLLGKKKENYCKFKKNVQKSWQIFEIINLKEKKVTTNEWKFFNNYNNSNIKHINKSNIKFIWKLLSLIFEIVINLMQFLNF